MKYPASYMLPALLLTPALSYSQTAVSLADVVDRAQKIYPSVQISQSQVEAAVAAIRLARTNYLPRFDSVAQGNRATRNNIYGCCCSNL